MMIYLISNSIILSLLYVGFLLVAICKIQLIVDFGDSSRLYKPFSVYFH